MQLTYRSAQYKVNAPVNVSMIETRQNQAIGMYRGISFPIQFPKVEQQFQSMIQLKYRGIPYVSSH
jgi:hypothetical protein